MTVLILGFLLCTGQKFEKFEKKGKFGIRNTETNKIVLKPKYSYIGDVNQPFTIIKSYNKLDQKEYSGLLRDGEVLLLNCAFDEVFMPQEYSDGVVRVFVEKSNKKFLIEIEPNQLKLVIDKPIKDFEVSPNGSKFINYELRPNTWVWKIEDKNGKVIYDFISDVTQLSGNAILLHDRNKDKYIIIDENGREIGSKGMGLYDYGYTSKPEGFYTSKIAVVGNNLVHLLERAGYFYKASTIAPDGSQKYGLVYGIYGNSGRFGPEIIEFIPFEYKQLKVSSRKLEHAGMGSVALKDFDILSIDTDKEIPDFYLENLSKSRGWVEATVNGDSRKLFNQGAKLRVEDDPEIVPETINIGDWEIFTENNKKGLRTNNGTILLPPVYTQISVTSDGKNNYKQISSFNGLFYLFQDKNYGVYNAHRKKIIVPVNNWESIADNYNFNGLKVRSHDGSVSYYLLNGVKIVGPFEESIRVLDKGTAVKKNGKWGFINTTGQQVIPFRYDKFDDESIGWSSRLIFYSTNGADITYYICDYNGRLVASQSFKSHQYKQKKDFILKYCN
ncbi:MAG: WG repeat-containing protein [Bacteroides sp.]|nr:WG repeat-containing protein [Bacteroides sp.]